MSKNISFGHDSEVPWSVEHQFEMVYVDQYMKSFDDQNIYSLSNLIPWQYWRTGPRNSSKTESIKVEIIIQMSFPEFVSLFSNVL